MIFGVPIQEQIRVPAGNLEHGWILFSVSTNIYFSFYSRKCIVDVALKRHPAPVTNSAAPCYDSGQYRQVASGENV